MFSNFPKHSVLNLQFIYIPTDKLDLDKSIYCIKATAAIPTALGDIKHLSKEFYFMIDHEQVTAIGKSLNISSNLTLKEKIIKPLSNISANSIYYIIDSSKVSKSIAYQLLIYLGLKLPYDVDSLNSFKKYLNKNLLGRRKW